MSLPTMKGSLPLAPPRAGASLRLVNLTKGILTRTPMARHPAFIDALKGGASARLRGIFRGIQFSALSQYPIFIGLKRGLNGA